MLVPVLFGVAILFVALAIVLSIAAEQPLFMAFVIPAIACYVVGLMMFVAHDGQTTRREIRRDLTRTGVEVVRTSQDYKADFIDHGKLCTAQVDKFKDKFFIERETQLCK